MPATVTIRTLPLTIGSFPSPTVRPLKKAGAEKAGTAASRGVAGTATQEDPRTAPGPHMTHSAPLRACGAMDDRNDHSVEPAPWSN